MALFNVSTAANTLLAVKNTAHAISEIINQDGADTDFESVREARAHWQLANVSTNFSSPDVLKSSTPLANGERIFIRLNNGTIVDTVVTGAQITDAPIPPKMTSNTLPNGVASSNSYDSGNAWKAFNQTNSDGVAFNGNTQYLSYNFENNDTHYVTQYRFSISTGSALSWVIEGSLNGTDWAIISTETARAHTHQIPVLYSIDSPGDFSHYRIRWTGPFETIYALDFLGEGTQTDTSAITNGETPDQVFKFVDTVKFNGATAVEKDIYYEFGTTGDKLYVLTLYEDVSLDGRQLSTRVDFHATGNLSTEITGQIFKEV